MKILCNKDILCYNFIRKKNLNNICGGSMYRVKKVLNHNTLIVVVAEEKKEYLIMGKGVGFGKKIGERIEARPEDCVYSMTELTERGDAHNIIKNISPDCLEIASEVLACAEKEFGKVDRSILFPMADHIEYALKRIQNQEPIRNPLTEDIKILFHREFKVASCVGPLLKECMDVDIDEHEIGYIALHIHSAIEEESISQAMQVAKAVRDCVTMVEGTTGKKIDVLSLAYNRLMNHVRFMVARALSDEKLKVSMNEYVEIKFPESFQMAEIICEQIGQSMNIVLDDVEIGYLAIHIERVVYEELRKE